MSPIEDVEDETSWESRLILSADEVLGKERRLEIILGLNEGKRSMSWIQEVIHRMEMLLEEEERIEILNRCSHMLPENRIIGLRELYQSCGSIDEVHRAWELSFTERLREAGLPEEWLNVILRNHWGEAGIKKGNLIIATKMPANLRAYFSAESELERRRAYCHCERIREAIGDPNIGLSSTFCNCGAGFYRYNWERIIGSRVKVRVLKSVLGGDDACSFEIGLPDAPD